MKGMKTPVTIEQEINNIFQLLTNNADENIEVKSEKIKRGSSCRGLIKISNRYAESNQDGKECVKNAMIIQYAFYPSTFHPTRLGSVAIYCSNAAVLCSRLQKQSALFGHRILSVKLEWGRRPFVDVRFAP